MSGIRTLIISPSEIATDPRVLRHIQVAREFGSVYTCGYGSEPEGVVEHFEIPANSRFLTRSIINLIAIQFGFHKFAARRTQFFCEASSQLRGREFDVVVANDVHSIQTVVENFELSRIWVDMHEYAPLESEHDWRWRIAYQRHVRHLCFNYLSKVAAVSSVGKNICKRYEAELHRPVDLIRNASNYHNQSVKEKEQASIPPLRCVHVGAAIRARQIEDLVTSIGGCAPKMTLDLFLIPTDEKYFSELLALASQYETVRINSPVPQSQLIDTISKFDVGCIAIPPTSFNYANCLPNKFFQYVQARIPIMSGPIPEVAEMIKSLNIGWVAEGFSEKDSTRCLESISQEQINQKLSNLDFAAKQLSSESDNEVRRSIIRRIGLEVK